MPPKFAGAPARRKETSTPPGGQVRKQMPPSITESDMLNADTEQLSTLLEFDLFGDSTVGGGTDDQFSNLEDDMAILDDTVPFADVTAMPPQPAGITQRTSPPPPPSQPSSQRPPTPQKTAAVVEATSVEGAQAIAAEAGTADTEDVSHAELSEASTRALSEDSELQNLFEGVQRATSDETAAQQKVAALRSKMAAAPNPVMKMRFTKELKEAEAALARASEAKLSAEAAASARRENLLNSNK